MSLTLASGPKIDGAAAAAMDLPERTRSRSTTAAPWVRAA